MSADQCPRCGGTGHSPEQCRWPTHITKESNMEIKYKIALMVGAAVVVWVVGEMLIHMLYMRKLRAMRSRHEGERRAPIRATDAMGFDPNTDQAPMNRRAGGQRRERARTDTPRGRRATDVVGAYAPSGPDRGYVEQ